MNARVTRRRIIRRIGQNPARCHYCDKPVTLDTSTLDHLIPVSRGGGAGDNLRIACRPCNNAKRDMLWHEFVLGPNPPRQVPEPEPAVRRPMAGRLATIVGDALLRGVAEKVETG